MAKERTEVSCCVKYLLFFFNVFFWVSLSVKYKFKLTANNVVICWHVQKTTSERDGTTPSLDSLPESLLILQSFSMKKLVLFSVSKMLWRPHFRFDITSPFSQDATVLCEKCRTVVYWYLSIQVLSFSFLQGISGVSRSQVNSYTLPEKSHPHRVTCFQIYYIGHGTFNSSLYVKNALKLEMLIIVFIVCLS